MSASREKKIRQELAAQGVPDIKEIRAAEERKQQRRTNILYGGIAAAFVLVAAALLVWNSNIIQRGSTAISVGNEKYSAAEVDYYYRNAVNSVLSSDYASLFSLNTSLPLQQQNLSDLDTMILGITLEEDEELSWHDYFVGLTKDSLVQQTALLKGANEAGYKLSDEAKAALADTMEQLASYAKQSGVSTNAYLKSIYGASMTTSTFEKLLTDATLTSAFQQEYIDGLDYTDAEIDKYYAENSEYIDIVSYEYVIFDGEAESTKDADGKTVEPTDEAKAAAKAAAEAAAKAAMARYQAGEDLETIAKDYDMANHVSVDAGTNSGGVLQEWLFADGRVAGDKTQIENGTDFYVLGFRDRSREEYLTVNVRHILCKVDDSKLDTKADDYKDKLQDLIDAEKAEADAILKEWQSGAKTAESFAELANKKSDDGGSNTNGGLYEDVYKGQMVTEFEDWCFADGRQVGDTGIVFVEGAGYTGYHVMYFDGFSEPYWKLLAINHKMSDDYNAWFEGLMDGLTAEEHSGMKYVG
ncbi:MAG: hypothetical protein E7469_03185 [Ruminococcaceae bacterium]|nr:hypothetical protein [Oscillospiraceae bacterium]